MIDVKIFATERQLEQLTGLTHDGLWDAGFDLDDWDIGFRFDEKMHREVEEDDPKDCYWNEIYPDYNSPYWWLMNEICNYCVGPTYCEFNGKHYYLVHHS